MNIAIKVIKLAPAQISTDNPTLFWPEEPTEALMKSLRDTDQITPVLVTRNDDEWLLLSGYARVMAAKAMDKTVLAREVVNVDMVEQAALYLDDNCHRPITPAMQVAALRALQKLEIEDESLHKKLGIKPKSKDARLLTDWLTLPESWDTYLAAGHAPLAIASVLAKLNAEDMESLAPMFEKLSWSRSNGVNFVTWLYEASRAHDTSIANLLYSHFTNLLDSELSPKDCMAKLCDIARRIRYPELSAMQDKTAETTRNLTKGSPWRAELPGNFESGAVQLSVKIKDRESLEKALASLKDMADSEIWETLWNMGGGND